MGRPLILVITLTFLTIRTFAQSTFPVNGVVDRSRPLCAYPAAAVYNGKGDTNDAASFSCR